MQGIRFQPEIVFKNRIRVVIVNLYINVMEMKIENFLQRYKVLTLTSLLQTQMLGRNSKQRFTVKAKQLIQEILLHYKDLRLKEQVLVLDKVWITR